ncbi:response regulator transcription factor [Gynurincola endophyticus]|jgi:DNA-binding CsgD family transcriptional regulator|uniref:response regulator transcription factor n=1 Tax=Gynurincola endophyticus TaxID=2479004 RepID=UPI000F8D032D|nr:helix-turn-helix transcriptional regulator [Gynurincola endophyticus]
MSVLNQVLNELKDKLFNDDKSLIFSIPREEKEPHLSDLSFKLKRIVDELKFIEEKYEIYKSLTKREKEIIRMIVQGDNNKDISDKLFISRRTVEQHRKNINKKLDVNNMSEIYFFAYSFNLV